MAKLRWEGDDKNQWLFSGLLLEELVWLEKRNKQWSVVFWLPGIDRGREYNSLEAHKKNAEEKVKHWFRQAAGRTARIKALPQKKEMKDG